MQVVQNKHVFFYEKSNNQSKMAQQGVSVFVKFTLLV